VTLSDAALDALQAYPWPGNVRELRNVLERAAVLAPGPVLGPADLVFDVRARRAAGVDDSALTLAEVERRHIERVLGLVGRRVQAAAERLGIPRSTLYQKLKQYGIVGPRGE
jgi:DNA-binding NtrC family response regulator